VLFGWLTGVVLNKAKGREMVTSFILAFFANGIYQLVVLYGMGAVIPIGNPALVLSRGYGIRNAINLSGIRQALDNLIMMKLGPVSVPLVTALVIAAMCVFILLFRRTKLGQDMRAVGGDMAIAEAAGINVERTRILSIVISTVLAGFGMIVYLQNVGTLNTYNSHEQVGMFSIAALLVGGASVSRDRIANVFLGVSLFHLLFVISPTAGKNLIGSAMLGEYFRVFISYGVISVALVLYALRKQRERTAFRSALRDQQGGGDAP
jgi:simple sugar transport system permease protein